MTPFTLPIQGRNITLLCHLAVLCIRYVCRTGGQCGVVFKLPQEVVTAPKWSLYNQDCCQDAVVGGTVRCFDDMLCMQPTVGHLNSSY